MKGVMKTYILSKTVVVALLALRDVYELNDVDTPHIPEMIEDMENHGTIWA